MVIDFHTHVFPEGMAKRVLEDLDRRAGIPHFSDGTLQGLVTSMDAAGIDISVVSRITTNQDQVPPVNRWLFELRGPRILVAATLHPDTPSLWDEIDWLTKAGIRGVKLHPDYQGFFFDEERMFPVYEALQAAGVWVLVHAGLDRGLPGRPVHATPQGLLRVHRAFPRLRIIAAHMGGEEVYEETEEILLGHDVYLDTSFVLRKMDEETLKRFARKHPTERLLFGSDSPWSHQGHDLEFLLSRPYLSDADKERITFENAAELLGLGDR